MHGTEGAEAGLADVKQLSYKDQNGDEEWCNGTTP